MKCVRKQQVRKKMNAVLKLEECGTCAQCPMEVEDGDKFQEMEWGARSQ
jgi:hypothetical protein